MTILHAFVPDANHLSAAGPLLVAGMITLQAQFVVSGFACRRSSAGSGGGAR